VWSQYRKISLSLAALAVCGLSVAAISLLLLRGVIQAKDLVIYRHAQDVVDVERLHVLLECKIAAGRGFLLSGDEDVWARAKAVRDDLRADIGRLSLGDDPVRRELLQRVADTEAAHQEALERAVQRRRHGLSEGAQAWEEDVRPRRERLGEAIAGAVRHERDVLDEARRRSGQAASTATRVILAVAALLIPGAGGVCVLAFRMLRRLSTAEAELAGRLREQAAAIEFGRHALNATELPALAHEATMLLSQAAGASLAAYFEPLPDGRTYVLRAGVGWAPGAVGELRIDVQGTALAEAVRSREARTLDPSGNGTSYPVPLLEAEGVRSGLLMPVVSRGGALGVLGLFSREPRKFGRADQNLMDSLANILAGAIEHRRSEDRLRAAVEAGPNAVLMADRDGRIALVNAQAEKLFGYGRGELLGRAIETLMPERYRPHHDGSRRDFFASLSSRAMGAGRELFGLRKDGTEVPVEIGLSPLQTDEGDFVIASIVDVTERRQAEEARRQLAAIVESSGDAIISADRQGKIQTWNAAAERLFGYSADEIRGTSALLLTPDEPGPRAAAAENVRRVLAGDSVTFQETFRQVKGGRRVPLALTLSPIHGPREEIVGISMIARDVAREREAREERRKSEEHFRLLVEAAEDYGIILLDPEGRVASWNPGAERILGYGGPEVAGGDFARFFSPEDVEKGLPRRHLERAARTGKACDENWLLRKDGTRFWASGTTNALRLPDGGLRGYLKIFRDLTERKRLEEEIQRLNSALESRVTERTMQLEAFTYSVSHDLRAPLRAMNGFSDALLHDYGHCLDDMGREYARRIVAACARMDALIQDLLNYSRLSGESLLTADVDVDALLSELLPEMEPQILEARAGVKVEGPLGVLRGHKVTLKQVIYNLLMNALKFVPPGVAPRVRVRSERRGDRLRLWVEDNGIGIDAAHQDRIFGVFERLHPGEYTGTGIGLAIVKKGVERMGGRVGVESAEGRGSRFFLELSAADGGASESQRSRPAGSD
jgi:PAS domain S-box-containing protein